MTFNFYNRLKTTQKYPKNQQKTPKIDLFKKNLDSKNFKSFSSDSDSGENKSRNVNNMKL